MNVKALEFIVKSIIFEDFAGCVRERERYQTSSKHDGQNDPQLDGKSMLK